MVLVFDPHTKMTSLSQACYKVVDNLATSLLQGCPQVVYKLVTGSNNFNSIVTVVTS